MELNEAAKLLMEIVDEIPQLNGDHFLIMTEEAPVKISTGYEVVTRTDYKKPDEKTKRALFDIADRHGLKVLEANNTISMFTPIAKEKTAIV